MKRSLLARLFCALMAVLLFSQAALAAPQRTQAGDADDLQAAILAAIQGRGEAPFLLFDTGLTRVMLSANRDWGTAWIYPLDPNTGEALPAEPGLVVAQWRDKAWQVFFPADPQWPSTVKYAPLELLSSAEKEEWLQRYTSAGASIETAPANAPYGGFLLPWAKGLKIILTRSITHYSPVDPSGSMHYSFDFAHPWVGGSSPMFNLYASKSGKVKYFRWEQADNDHASPGNYLVVEDATTIPTTYHVYLHLGYDSIPPELRAKGAPVFQGQYIGKAGNTGKSTGNHLHFQVHTSPYSYWGTAVDITFDDVTVNGGRPRTKGEATYYPAYGSQWQVGDAYYSSNNIRADFVPPQGGILAPAQGARVTTGSMTVEAWATDDKSGVYSAHVLADWGSGWQAVAGPFNTALFSSALNLCTLGVPDGPFSLALRIQDWENNLSPDLTGLTHYIKEYTCQPPPVCTPAAGEVALFSGTDYRGACQVFPAGVYSAAQINLAKISSIRTGSQAQATLFQGAGSLGRAESFFADDPALADNRYGTRKPETLLVAPRSSAPAVPQPVWPTSGTGITSLDSLSLAWEDRGGGQRFDLRLNGPTILTTTLTGKTAWNLSGANLAPGAYTWQVKSANAAGESAFSAAVPFTVSVPTAPMPLITYTLPTTLDMEAGGDMWSKTGLWHLDDSANHTGSGTKGWAYRQPKTTFDTSLSNRGSLTSPLILIPDEGAVMRFWYRYQTEDPGRHWDQRWVQISVNEGPFTDLLQLHEDVPDTWLQSPQINLSAFAGQPIRLRFYFDSLDANFNSYYGWEIDDLVFETGPGQVCSDLAGGTPESARPIALGSSQAEMICPGGDTDFFAFTAAAGQSIEAFVQAQTISSTLDTVLFLLDMDKQSVLASNDDIMANQRTDSALSYTFTRGGTYYLKVRSWNHPTTGEESAFYNLTLQPSARPAVSLSVPTAGEYLPLTAFNLTAALSDAGSGPFKVAFYVHGANWKTGAWQLLGTDTDGSNGWSLPVDPSTLPEGRGVAFYALGYDTAGLTSTSAVWSLNSDHTPPVTTLKPLPSTSTSTAVRLEWSASDNVSGINLTSIQRKLSGSSYTDWFTTTQPLTSTWMVGEFGQPYSFRMQARDAAGNWEALPSSAEATTIIQATCPGDGFEGSQGNNTPQTAGLVTGTLVTQTHTFCNPVEGTGHLNDEDWLAVTIPAGQTLLVKVVPVSPAAAVQLELYSGADASTLLLDPVVPANFGQPSSLMWQAGESDETVYVRMRHIDGRVAGSGTSYTVSIVTGYPVWLPVTLR